MTPPARTPPQTPAHDRGRKLIGLYRRGVGGERDNAGRLLTAHLRTHDLTLYDLDPSLPVTQDLRALDGWRESAGWLARLGTPEQEEVLTRLVDAPDLTDAELDRVLQAVDLERLVGVRADGWAFAGQIEAAEVGRLARLLTPAEIRAQAGSLAQRVQAAVGQRHHALTHPQRLLRTKDALEQHLFLGFIQAVGGSGAQLTEGGVTAALNAEQLARVRTLTATYREGLTRQVLRAAEELALDQGRRHP